MISKIASLLKNQKTLFGRNIGLVTGKMMYEVAELDGTFDKKKINNKTASVFDCVKNISKIP